MTKTNKKGRELLDNVNADHDKRMWERREMQLGDFKKGAAEFIGQIKGQSTGQQEWSRGDFQQKKQSSWLKKRGIFEGRTAATPEQIALKKKRGAAAKLKEAKRVEKRQRGSRTLAKRKMEVPAYLQKMEDLKKYKKGFQILLDYYGLSSKRNRHFCDPAILRTATQLKLKKLGLVK